MLLHCACQPHRHVAFHIGYVASVEPNSSENKWSVVGNNTTDGKAWRVKTENLVVLGHPIYGPLYKMLKNIFVTRWKLTGKGAVGLLAFVRRRWRYD